MGQTWPVHLAGGMVQAAGGMFVATNIDDLVVLMVFFGRARGGIGQRSFGLWAANTSGLPRFCWCRLWVRSECDFCLGPPSPTLGCCRSCSVCGRRGRPGAIAAETMARTGKWVAGPAWGFPLLPQSLSPTGGDNIGVYVPVFAAAGPSGMPAYIATFLIGVGLWCVLSNRIASHPGIAHALERWEHVLLPVVLIAIGIAILVGGAGGRSASRQRPSSARPGD